MNKAEKFETNLQINENEAHGMASAGSQVYLAGDIQQLLNIGRSRCYTYLEEVYRKQQPFRVIKIGKLFRIPKQSFDEWLNGNNLGKE